MRPFLLISGILFISCFLPSTSSAGDFIWLEGEQPASSNVKWTVATSSHPDWLSGGKWLTFSIDDGKVEKELPEDGALFEYAIPANADGKRELWARIGFEFARSEFQWRIDDGGWSTVSPDTLTRTI